MEDSSVNKELIHFLLFVSAFVFTENKSNHVMQFSVLKCILQIQPSP